MPAFPVCSSDPSLLLIFSLYHRKAHLSSRKFIMFDHPMNALDDFVAGRVVCADAQNAGLSSDFDAGVTDLEDEPILIGAYWDAQHPDGFPGQFCRQHPGAEGRAGTPGRTMVVKSASEPQARMVPRISRSCSGVRSFSETSREATSRLVLSGTPTS